MVNTSMLPLMSRDARLLPVFAGTPVDRRGRVLRDVRLSVTDRCNFRCGYCMPAEVYGPDFAFLPRAELLSFEEIALVARELVGLDGRAQGHDFVRIKFAMGLLAEERLDALADQGHSG